MPDLPVPNPAGDNLTTTIRNICEYLYYLAQNGGGGGGASLPSQTGNAGKVLGTDGTDALWQTIPPALPVWTYTAGVIGSGLFTTNNALIQNTSSMEFPENDQGGSVGWGSVLQSLPAGTSIILTNSSGVVAAFGASSITPNGGNTIFAGSMQVGSGSWSGDYQLSFVYANQVTLDSLYALNVPPISGTTGEFSPVTSITVVNGIVTSVSS